LNADDRDSTERLALLSPHAAVSSVPGHGRTTWEDIAGAIANCSRGAVLYGHIKIAGHDGLRPELVRHCMAVAMNYPAVKWPRRPVMRPGVMRCMIELVLAEAVSTGICRTCNGRGQAMIEDHLLVCGDCGGVGRERITDDARMEAIGASEFDWRRTWDRIHGDCHAVIGGWERELAWALDGI